MDNYDIIHGTANISDGTHAVNLERWCRACEEVFTGGESFKSVYLDEAEDTVKVVGPYWFPEERGQRQGQRQRQPQKRSHGKFANADFYTRHTAGGETVTIHADCFNLFRRSCTADNVNTRLLLAALWRSPWERAPKFEVDVIPDVAGLIQTAAAGCNMPQLQTMPMELKRMVWKELITQPSAVTRYQNVIGLAADASRQGVDKQAVVPIGKVASWERGEAPASREDNLPPVIRIVIDSQGIKRIERLAQKPELLSEQSDTELYIVEHQMTLGDVLVHFRSGLARLKVLGDPDVDFLIPWDTPTPPAIEHLLPVVVKPYSRVLQFSTIDLSKVTGLSFFMTWNVHTPTSETFGPEFYIHAHTAKTPSALPTFERLSAQDWNGVWHYVPFSSDDRLTFFGVRHVFNIYLHILLRFEKAGDVIVGFQSPAYPDAEDAVWPAGDQLQLICGLSSSGNAETVDVHPQRNVTVETPFEAQTGHLFQNFDHGSFVTSAPLEQVVRLTTFTDADMGIWRGLLLEYENGAQRTVGECRVGLDVERVYVKPLSLCIGQKRRSIHWKVKVKVDYDPDHTHAEDGWDCFEMRGWLVYWYMRGRSQLSVVDPDSWSG